MIHSRHALSLLILSLLFTASGAAAPPLPSTKDIADLVDGKKYSDALVLLTRVLNLKGDAALPYDRHQLLMLKTECLLQLHDYPNSLTTLAAVQKEAKTPEEGYAGLALEALVRKSPSGAFTPKGAPTAKKLNILDPSERKEAFKQLWDEELSALQAEVKADKSYTTILPIMEDARSMTRERAIEYVATGKTDRTDKLANQLKEKALKLLNNSLKNMTTKVDNIDEKANTRISEVVAQSGVVRRTHKAGLTFAQIQSLQDIESTCSQFGPTLRELAQIFAPEAKTFADIAVRASQLQAKATKVRTAQY